MADKKSREGFEDAYGNEWDVVAKSSEGVTVGKRDDDGSYSVYDSLTHEEYKAITGSGQLASLFAGERVISADEAKKTDLSALTVKLDVDVSDAITGLKALQREAKDATKALREVEAVGNVDPDVAHLLWKHYGITPEVAAKMGDDVRARYVEFIAHKAQQDGVKLSGTLINVSANEAEDVARRLVEGMRRKHGGGGA